MRFRLQQGFLRLRGFPIDSGNAGFQCAARTVIPGFAMHETGCNKLLVRSTLRVQWLTRDLFCKKFCWRFIGRRSSEGVFADPRPPPTELENTQSHYSILVSSQAGYYLERAEYDRRDATLLNLGKS